ncbi:MAG: hypothetical protein ABH842_00525 [Candidatus Micrarchaeota archaeon]
MEVEFSSGGANHPIGYGEWGLKFSGNQLSIIHNVKGKITGYGTFQLDENELKQFEKIPELKNSERDGIPDEVMYTFRINGNVAGIWANDFEEQWIIGFFTKLIKKYTNQDAILR